MPDAKDILTIAAAEIGTREYPANSNRVKYNTVYYGWEASGNAYPWCCVFMWWCFRQAGASNLFYGGNKTASCTTLFNDYKQRGQAVKVKQAQPGDLVFFNLDGNPNVMNHVGVCESCDGKYVTTIDGNTGTDNEANGGAVMRRTRELRYVGGVARPTYLEEAKNLTREEIIDLVHKKVQTALEAEKPKVYATLNDVPGHYQPSIKKLMDAKVLTGYDGGIDDKLETAFDNTIMVDETFCRIVTVLDRANVLRLA